MTSTSAALCEVGTFIAGSGFPLHFQGQTSGSYPFAKVGDISRCARSGRQELGDAEHWVDDEVVAQLRAKIVPANAILFAKIGEAIQQNFRVIASRSMLIDNNAMAYVAGGDRLDHRYAFHFLKSIDMYRLASSTTVPSLRKSTLEEISVPLPPLPEQRRIAAILDKADALRAKRRVAIAKLDQLLQSVFLDMFGDPVTNPKGWPVASLGDLASWKSGGTPSRSNPAYFTGNIPWYTSGELDGIFISDSAERITKQAVTDSAAKLMDPGTLMIGMYDTSAFKLGITVRVGTCNQAIAFGLINSAKAETLYVYHALDLGKEHFKRLQRGVRQKNLNLSMVRDTRVPCPPVKLQQKFSSWFATYWRDVSKQHQAEEHLTKLSMSLQTSAFKIRSPGETRVAPGLRD